MQSMRSRRRVVWIALAAIALQAFWPLIAQAKPESVLLVPVCSVRGVTHYIELPRRGAPVERKAASQQDHCAFCVFGGERVALPAGAPVLPIAAAAAFGAPRSSESRFLESQKRLNARSRAPPIQG